MSQDLFGEEHEARKRCKRCKESLPLSSFYFIRNANGKRYPYTYCKDCGRKNTNEWNKTPDGRKHVMARNLKREFGLTVKEFENMAKAQAGVCAICGKPETCLHRRTKLARNLSVDHDHTTGKIRGLLCSTCNQGLGYFKDDPKIIEAAIKYLEKHKYKTTQPQEG